MIYLPVIGSLLEGIGMILEKKILREHRIDYKNYTVYGFLSILLVMLPFIYFLWGVSPEALEIKNVIVFALIVIISIFANLFTFYSLKREDLSELEPIRLMQPLLTILLAFILSFFFSVFSNERNYSILILGMIASIALIVPHIRKHHLCINKCIIAALIGSFLFAFELVLSKFILSYYGSFTFYFLRCLFIFLISWAIFHSKIKSIKTKTKLTMLLVSAIWMTYRIILYYGYNNLGIVFTTTLFILTPVFIFIFASIFLKEKIKLKHIISSIIIITCVVIAIIIENRQMINSIIKVFLP